MSASVGISAAACARKRPYRTSKAAKRALRSLRAAGGGHRLNVFRCERCGSWHVGRRPTTGRGGVRAA